MDPFSDGLDVAVGVPLDVEGSILEVPPMLCNRLQYYPVEVALLPEVNNPACSLPV